MGEPWEDCDNKCLRAGKCVTGRCDVLTDMHGAVVDIFPKDPPPAEPSGQVVGETLLRNDNPPGGVVSLAEAVLLGKPLTIMNDAGEWVGEGMHAERLPQYHTPSAPPTTAHPVQNSVPPACEYDANFYCGCDRSKTACPRSAPATPLPQPGEGAETGGLGTITEVVLDLNTVWRRAMTYSRGHFPWTQEEYHDLVMLLLDGSRKQHTELTALQQQVKELTEALTEISTGGGGEVTRKSVPMVFRPSGRSGRAGVDDV
jgi:hypothetical protein